MFKALVEKTHFMAGYHRC